MKDLVTDFFFLNVQLFQLMEVVASQSLWLSQYEAIFQEVLLRRDGLLILKKVLEYGIDFTKHQLGRENKRAFKMCWVLSWLVVSLNN